jgi:hypothetical protein
MDQKVVDKYIECKRLIKDLEQELKELKKDASTVEAELLQQFMDDGVQSVKTDSGKTVYLMSQLWAGKDPEVSDEQFLTSMKENGLEDLIQEKVNTQTLSAVMREQAGDYINLEDVSTPFGVRLSEKVSVRVRGL